MAVTQLSDVIVPEFYAEYSGINAMTSTGLFESGVLIPNPKNAYSLPCHGRGRGFEPRRPRHESKGFRFMGDPKKTEVLGLIWVQ